MSSQNVVTPSMIDQLLNQAQGAATYSSSLEGKLLTLADAILSDREQRQAFKDLLKQTVRNHYTDVCRELSSVINQFTDTFEGETIKYQKISNFPYSDLDCRDGSVPQRPNMFTK